MGILKSVREREMKRGREKGRDGERENKRPTERNVCKKGHKEQSREDKIIFLIPPTFSKGNSTGT